jgi:hypothetical protein
VVVVGARPIEYKRASVRDRRTGELREIDIHEADPVDQGDDGIPYVFRTGQRVNPGHPAYESAKAKAEKGHAFVTLEEAEDQNLIEA